MCSSAFRSSSFASLNGDSSPLQAREEAVHAVHVRLAEAFYVSAGHRKADARADRWDTTFAFSTSVRVNLEKKFPSCICRGGTEAVRRAGHEEDSEGEERRERRGEEGEREKERVRERVAAKHSREREEREEEIEIILCAGMKGNPGVG